MLSTIVNSDALDIDRANLGVLEYVGVDRMMTRRVADLILHNANVLTIDQKMPRAQLIAIKEGRIVWVGSNDGLELCRGPNTRLIDCEGRAVVPGFNDAHTHVLAFAASLVGIDCRPSSVSSIADIQAKIRRRAEETHDGSWIRATGYNEFYLAEKRHPTRWDLDLAAPSHPVRLTHRSLHACVLSSLALSLAGISKETPDPPGGIIDRDWDTAEPTGLLFEMNTYIGEKVVPPLTDDELDSGIRLANHEYLSLGITSLQDATARNGLAEWQTFQRLRQRGDLSPRVVMMIGLDAIADFQEAGLSYRFGDERLRLGAVKIAIDETTGALYPRQLELNEAVLLAHEGGFQVALHAIEEGTVAAALAALEYALSQSPKPDHRHRIEHCSVCPPPLLERLKAIGCVVVTQPSFLYFSGERYLGEVPASQLPWLYRLRSFLEGGLALAASSDSPVVPPNPLIGIYAASTRRAETGQVLPAEETISPMQALGMYTLGAAYAAFEDGVKGSISVGKLADLAVLSADPTQVPPEEIKEIKVEKTIIGGEIVWEK